MMRRFVPAALAAALVVLVALPADAGIFARRRAARAAAAGGSCYSGAPAAYAGAGAGCYSSAPATYAGAGCYSGAAAGGCYSGAYQPAPATLVPQPVAASCYSSAYAGQAYVTYAPAAQAPPPVVYSTPGAYTGPQWPQYPEAPPAERPPAAAPGPAPR